MNNKLYSVIVAGVTMLVLSSCSPDKDNCTKYVQIRDIKILNNHWFSEDEYVITYEDNSIGVTTWPSMERAKCVARDITSLTLPNNT